MDPFMEFFGFTGADEMTISNNSAVVHERNLSATSEVLHHHQLAEPHRRMANVHNLPSMNVLQAMDQRAGSSQHSKDQSNPKKLAKQRSDIKYREKKKQEMVDLKRKANDLTERNEVLEEQNASLQMDVDRLAKALKQCEKDVCHLKDKHDGLTTTITEISMALSGSKYVDVLRENEQLKYEKEALLINHINNPNTMDIIQLQAKIAQLESEVSSRQLVIDALCKKMKTDN